ncbi:MAG: VOC family protein [Fodinibius sp.]|nr:VOC family protein [Fodinibius sp.]
MFNLTFDHYTIKVTNLENSTAFYGDFLGLRRITNRTEKEYIRRALRLGNGTELHIVEGDTDAIKKNIGVHLALKLSGFETFVEHLKSHGITPHDSKGNAHQVTTRADGVRQVYFQDPDGYWIEVNEAAAP